METVTYPDSFTTASHQPVVVLPAVTGGGEAIHCPFVTCLNPSVTLAEQRGLTWVQRFGLPAPPKVLADGKLEYVRFSAFVHPHASLDRLQIVSDFFTWLFLLDDKWDESEQGKQIAYMAQLQDRFMEILRDGRPEAHDDPFTHALYDLRTRIVAFGSETVLARFAQSLHDYLEAGRWEVHNRSHGIIPDVRSYLDMRTRTGAVYPCFDLIGVMDRFELPNSQSGCSRVSGPVRAPA